MRSYRPVGWRFESYRHYLASKGIKTSPYFAHKYFANDAAKGPGKRSGRRTPTLIARGHAKDFTNDELSDVTRLRQLAVRSPPQLREQEVQDAIRYLVEENERNIPLPESIYSRAREMPEESISSQQFATTPLPEVAVPVVPEPEPEVIVPPDIAEEPVTQLESSSELQELEAEQPEKGGTKTVVGNVASTPGTPEVAPFDIG
jgi:hypothetical protein